MPRGHEHIPIRSLSINAHLSGHFLKKFSYNKIVMGIKIIVQCLDVIMIAFFLKNMYR